MKYYTIGEIYRLGLLKNHKGEPYKHKATISRLVNGIKYKEKQTPWGMAKVFSEQDLKSLLESL